MDFYIEPYSNYLQEDLKFSVNLKNWTEIGIYIQINFAYPELVS
jgi:hypothetical protein